MNWNNYLPLAEKTMSLQFNADEKDQKVLHGVIGICTEAGELFKALMADTTIDRVNIKEELGDVCWYIAILMREYPVDGEFIQNTSSVVSLPNEIRVSTMIDNSLDMLDLMKKKIYYGKALEMPVFQEHLSHVLNAVNGLAANFNLHVGDILETNINKLKARYGDKFSSERAINRDLDTERGTLEK